MIYKTCYYFKELPTKEKTFTGYRDGSVVSNTGCSFTDMDSVPSNHMEASNHLKLSSGNPMAYSGLCVPQACIWCANTHADKTPTHVKFFKKKYLKKEEERGLRNFWF